MLLFQKLRVDLTEVIKSGVYLVLRDRGLISNQFFKLCNLLLIFGFELFNVNLRALDI